MTAYIAPHYSYQDRKISRSIWYAAFLAVPNTAALWNLLIIRQALHTLSSSSTSHVSIRLYDDGPHYRVILDFTSWSPDIWTWWTKSSLMSSPHLVCTPETRYSKPWYSKILDIVNKTQLPSWDFIEILCLDIVNDLI